MSAIQVKNVPDDLHEALRARAKAEGKTVGEVILEALRRDLRQREMRDWLDHLREVTKDFPKVSREELDAIMAEARAERRWADDPLDDLLDEAPDDALEEA
jgi:plasmid stability protein